MNQQQLNREVAEATGESINTIRQLGFSPLTTIPMERDPLIVDWDELEESREILFPA
jgi:hypothetical protein